MKLSDWLDHRTGYRKLAAEALDEPVPGGARWSYVWGSALALTFAAQAVTGWLLMTVYQPSARSAWSSVWYAQNHMSWGWLVRGVHHFGAQAMVVLLAAHLGQTALYGAYVKPRELNWLLGVGLMALTLGFALTGYLLPWDQKGYWATRVATNIAGSVPIIGRAMQRLLIGGAEYGNLTLTRFYSLHVALLPAALVLLLVAHVALFRRHGVTPGAGADSSRVDRFYPKQVLYDLLASCAVLALVIALALRNHGAGLDAPADPASDYPARPEWYFLALFELLKHVPGRLEWIAAALVPLAAVGYLVALPFCDHAPSRRARARVRWLAPLGLMLAAAVGLTWKSVASDRADAAFLRARDKAEQRAQRASLLAERGVPPQGPLALLASDPDTRGPELFERHCAGCHRLAEMGPPDDKIAAPSLSGWGTREWVSALLDNPDAAHLFGRTPFKGMMDSFTRPPADPEQAKEFKPLGAGERDAIAQFLAAQARGETGKDSAGEKLVKQKCTECHRLDGQEPLDPDSLAPELRGWASLAWTRSQIANPGGGHTYAAAAMSDGLKGHMPAFAADLDAADIDLLARWLTTAARKN